MLKEYISYKNLCELSGINRSLGRYEYCLFDQAIHYYKDIHEILGLRELFYEIHGYGFPGLWGDGQLLE